jgi:hypothetical protein
VQVRLSDLEGIRSVTTKLLNDNGNLDVRFDLVTDRFIANRSGGLEP